MCGRFDFHGETADITKLIEALGQVDASAQHYNLAPTQAAMAAHVHVQDQSVRLAPMRFGMPWPHKAGVVLNARSETVTQKPMFRTAFTSRRCLVFANGFYEWTKRGTRKQPYYFTLEEAPVFAFAALYTVAKDKGPGFVILTTQANDTVAPMHHRMPVILPPQALQTWLNRDTSPDAALNLLAPYNHGPMRAFAVTPQVNSPSYTSPQCIAPIALA